MEVVLDTVHEELHDVLGGGGSFGALPFHDGDQLSDDFTLFVSVGRKNHQDELLLHILSPMTGVLFSIHKPKYAGHLPKTRG